MPSPRTSEGKLVVPARLGRYDLYGEIASGGVATVYLGRMIGKAGFERTVAVKVLHRHLATDPEFVAMFLDEARLSARIRHPNIVDVFDVDALDGELFIVMEYVEGAALNWILRFARDRKREVPLGFSLRVMHEVLLGLHAAHELTDVHEQPIGLVHRDVSPQNILVGVDGIARVSDFGIAKAAGRIASTRGRNTVKGKLRYLSPEQLTSSPTIDRRTDVFAAGIVLWECLTRRPLFAAETEGETMARLLNGRIQPPSELSPGVPPEIDRICLMALERDLDRRFPTALAFADALEESAGAKFCRGRDVGALVRELAHESIDRGRAALNRPPTALPPDSSKVPSDSMAQPLEIPGIAAKPPGVGWKERRWLSFTVLAALALSGGGLVAWFIATPPAQAPATAAAHAPGASTLPPTALSASAVAFAVSAPAATPLASPSASALADAAPTASAGSSSSPTRKRPRKPGPFMPSDL
jgi:eukaryotic-like serine/threonine-protein kinase